MTKKLILVGGGTGGHVLPLLNLHSYLKKSDSSILFHWIGESESLESRLSQENGIDFSPIVCGKLRRYYSWKTLLLPFQIAIGIVQSVAILLRKKPSAIFSKGGYVSLPVAIAGWILRIPVYLHESDSVPGLANRLVAGFATGIFASFPEAEGFFNAKKILGHGPLLSLDIPEIAKMPIEIKEKTQFLISCGSQGSSRIFDAVLTALPDMADMDVHVVLGTKNLDYRTKFERFPNVRLYDFFYNQQDYLKLVHNSDIALTRSSSNIFEFEALGLYMIMVPLPESGNGHQYHNARIFEKKGHTCVLQNDLTEALPGIVKKYSHYKK